jgi:hypothetical protein
MSPATYIAGQAVIDEMDELNINLERKWGAGRLRLLVPVETRERFDRQRYLVQHAIQTGSLEDVRQQCARMVKALKAVDDMAERAGAKPQAAEVWEGVGPSGAVYAIVKSVEDAHKVHAKGRKVSVYSIDEIVRLLEAFPTVAKAKAVFEGAEVVQAHSYVGDPLNGLADAVTPLDDELPW